MSEFTQLIFRNVSAVQPGAANRPAQRGSKFDIYSWKFQSHFLQIWTPVLMDLFPILCLKCS